MHLDREGIEGLEKRYRAALINSLSGCRAAVLVGTADRAGHSNLAIMSSLVHIGSHPPLLGLVLRPDSVERHTLENIRETGVYTVNHVHRDFLAAAHQTSARYPREQSEFAATGLEALWRGDFAAPYVAASPVRLGLELRDELRLEINATHLLVGEIMRIDCPDGALGADGGLDPAACDCVAVAGLDRYYRPDLLTHLAYAKPDRAPRSFTEPAGEQRGV
jgi:flavin reductase (DIM6/NTAB) family NADH-FMN oxidoreductase RutF